MIRTLLWKEYRELRTTAAVLTLAAVMLLFGIQASEIIKSADAMIHSFVAVSLVWMAGLVTGAQPFANEIENRTHTFLNMLPVPQRRVSRTKFVAVLMFLAVYVVVLYSLGAAMKWIDPKHLPIVAIAMLAFGLSGVGCGLCGSALARSPLGGIGWAIIFQVALLGVSTLIAIVVGIPSGKWDDDHWPIYTALMCSPLPFIYANLRYTRTDRHRAKAKVVLTDHHGEGWQSLLWLSWRQTRRTFWTLFILGFFAALALQVTKASSLWMPISMVFGIIAGVGTFSADHPGEAYRFLGDRRLPYGRLWLVKTGMSLATLAVPIFWHWAFVVVDFMSTVTRDFRTSFGTWNVLFHFVTRIHVLHLDHMLLGGVYGLALGQFLGMVCRKSAIAAAVAVLLGIKLLAVWWPSVIVGGLSLWQWIIPPLFLLAAMRSVIRPWIGGRLGSWRLIGVLAGSATLAVLGLAGGLWYRVAEVSEPNDPFDVVAFQKSLPTLEQNEAGRKLSKLLKRYPMPFQLYSGGATTAEEVNRRNELEYGAASALATRKWPMDNELLNQIMDKEFENPWYDELRKAVALPLGREVELVGTRYADSNWGWGTTEVGKLLNYRMLQLASRGDASGAFEAAFLALDLSRHLRSKATPNGYLVGSVIEQKTLELLPTLLEAAGDKPELLEQSLSRLTANDKAVPPLNDVIRINYLQMKEFAALPQNAGMNRDKFDRDAMAIAVMVPWEQSRSYRILAAAFAGYLRTSEASYAETRRRMGDMQFPKFYRNWLIATWSPPMADKNSWASEVTKMQHLLDNSRWNGMDAPQQLFPRELVGKLYRRATQLQLALVVYQIRHGKPAASLSELVPSILQELPLDPYNDEPFHYRVSQGETIEILGYTREQAHPSNVAAGQGMIWSVGPDLKDDEGKIDCPASWWPYTGQPSDVVFLVPGVWKR